MNDLEYAYSLLKTVFGNQLYKSIPENLVMLPIIKDLHDITNSGTLFKKNEATQILLQYAVILLKKARDNLRDQEFEKRFVDLFIGSILVAIKALYEEAIWNADFVILASNVHHIPQNTYHKSSLYLSKCERTFLSAIKYRLPNIQFHGTYHITHTTLQDIATESQSLHQISQQEIRDTVIKPAAKEQLNVENYSVKDQLYLYIDSMLDELSKPRGRIPTKAKFAGQKRTALENAYKENDFMTMDEICVDVQNEFNKYSCYLARIQAPLNANSSSSQLFKGNSTIPKSSSGDSDAFAEHLGDKNSTTTSKPKNS